MIDMIIIGKFKIRTLVFWRKTLII